MEKYDIFEEFTKLSNDISAKMNTYSLLTKQRSEFAKSLSKDMKSFSSKYAYIGMLGTSFNPEDVTVKKIIESLKALTELTKVFESLSEMDEDITGMISDAAKEFRIGGNKYE